MQETKEQLVITPLPANAPVIGRWLGVLSDTRERTLRELEGTDQAQLDWQQPGMNGIGTLLAHIAAIEMDWLYAEILEQEFPAHVLALLPEDVRDTQGNLWVVTDLPLEEHLRRLAETRAIFITELQQRSEDDFYLRRSLPRYDVTPEWVLHHLAQHEAGHRSDIAMMRAAYTRSR